MKQLSNTLSVPNLFLTNANYNNIITIGNLRGGRIKDIRGVKLGRIVTLYFQINDITSGGSDVTIFTFKDKKYYPIVYGVTSAFVSNKDNIVYIGLFSNGSFSMAISGNGVINSSSKVMVLCSVTYISQG